jgi:hypothetical protein
MEISLQSSFSLCLSTKRSLININQIRQLKKRGKGAEGKREKKLERKGKRRIKTYMVMITENHQAWLGGPGQ